MRLRAELCRSLPQTDPAHKRHLRHQPRRPHPESQRLPPQLSANRHHHGCPSPALSEVEESRDLGLREVIQSLKAYVPSVAESPGTHSPRPGDIGLPLTLRSSGDLQHGRRRHRDIQAARVHAPHRDQPGPHDLVHPALRSPESD